MTQQLLFSRKLWGAFLVMVTLHLSQSLNAQIVLNEIIPGGQVEIKNTGGSTVDISSYWLCNFPTYTQLSSLTLECGSLNLAAGEIVAVSGFSALSAGDGEMGLYSSASFSSPAAMVSYLQWGSAGHQRESVAVAAGVWTMGAFVASIPAGSSLAYDGEGNTAADWSAGTSTFCDENSGGCDAEGGQISTTDPTEICAGDGVGDPINVVLANSQGTNSAWVITDANGNILALPEGGPFDLEGAGSGICLIWHLSYEDGLTGLMVDQNTANLSGCFDLSNAITVTRTGVNGGEITTNDPTTICAGDGNGDPINVALTGNEGANSGWVITDANGTILGLPPGPPFDLEGAGEGVCLIWHISYEDGLSGLSEGQNTANLDGCFALSNSITVVRNGVAGGEISTIDPTEICAGDGVGDPINVLLVGNEGTNSAWVITDANGTILGLPESGPFDLEGAGGGVCLIWHLSYEDGLTGLAEGENTANLDGCFDLSNAITVTRTGVNGGEISTNDPTTICAGDDSGDPISVGIVGTEGANSAWVITDTDGMILGLPPGPPFDLDGAGAGVCLIWHLSYEDGLTGLAEGQNTADLEGCFDLSNSITVTRYTGMTDGGQISTTDPTEICAGDGVGDPINVTLSANIGSNSAWVITDANGIILGLPAGPPFDLEGAGGGTCLIWHLSYEDGLVGLEMGMDANDLQGCHDLSNPIIVTRTGVEGGELSTTDPTEICAGDGTGDPIDVSLSGNEGANSGWVITDTDGNILGLPAAPPFDLDGAGAGTCLIWHLSYEDGLTGLEMGMNANNLEGCFDLSNPITVVRTGINGGEISTNDPTEICAGDGSGDPIEVALSGNEGSNSGWVITDTDGNILGLPAAPPFDLDGAGAGTCLIWHISYEDGLTGLEMDMNTDDLEGCFALSNPITVVRTGVDGGMVSTTDGTTEVSICVGDGSSDELAFQTTSTTGTYQYVITDDNNMILGLPLSNMQDFEGAGYGVCRVWGLSYTGNLTAQEGDDAAAIDLSDDCFVLSSNFIEVTRDTVGANCVVSTFDVNPDAIAATLAPNPVQDILQVSLQLDDLQASVSTLRIYSATGKLVQEESGIATSREMNLEVSLGNVSAGLYLLSFQNGDRILTRRFVKN